MNETLRVLSAILILGGILLLAYSGITYARTIATPAAETIDQLPASPEDNTAREPDDPTWAGIGGAACLAIGIGLLFIPRGPGTNVSKKTRYHTQYRT